MTDRDALLKTIRESPGDDAPRLVYCDWMEDHGKGEEAAFLRECLTQPRRESTAFQMAGSRGPNSTEWVVFVPDESGTPEQAAADAIREAAFDLPGGEPIWAWAVAQETPAVWRVTIYYDLSRRAVP